MKVYPYERYQVETNKSVEDVVAAIDNECEKWSLDSFFYKNGKKLVGGMDGRKFKFYRNIGYRNSFLPIVVGIVEESLSGSVIKITLRLNRFSMIFMAFVFAVCILVGSVAIFKVQGLMSVMPFIIVALGYCIMQSAFWVEANKIKAIMNDIFEPD